MFAIWFGAEFRQGTCSSASWGLPHPGGKPNVIFILTGNKMFIELTEYMPLVKKTSAGQALAPWHCYHGRYCLLGEALWTERQPCLSITDVNPLVARAIDSYYENLLPALSDKIFRRWLPKGFVGSGVQRNYLPVWLQ